MPALPPIDSLADSIDEVVDRLNTVIAWSRESRSRLGYFAALYRRVTLKVGEGARGSQFEDGARMQRFDLLFANRYLQALIDLRNGTPPSRVWSFAFENAQSYWPIVLQHLLLGMNAHINLDLGIAAAQTMRGEPIENLRGDFNRINAILASLVDEIQQELGRVWLTLQLFNRLLGSADDALVEFSMWKARDEAWRTAERLWNTPEAQWPSAIREQDAKMLPLARLIRKPGIVLGSVVHIVRLGEVQDIAQVVQTLGS